MKFAKIFKFFKKGAKAAAKQRSKKGAEPAHWPAGTRIGVFGHANSGKTVYFTVLNEECKISKKLQISVTDNMTASEFLSNYRSIWGLGTATDAGTVVDFQGEKKFPEPTSGDKILKFNAIVDRKKKISVVAYDYNGKAISLSPESKELSEKITDFMLGCDGLLFFYDPKILGAELESQARVASFVNLLEMLAPIRVRLPIPIGVVVTKSDILPGFSEEKVNLIGPEEEYLASEDFEIFLEKVMSGPMVASDPQWSGSVRNVLVKLKDFLRVVLRRTLDFQIFFISSTGQEPEKVGTEVGRSVYKPPSKMKPVGVKEPFYWLLNSIVRNKRISRMRSLTKYVATASLIWILLFSIPFFSHLKILYPRPGKVETRIAEMHNGSLLSANTDERGEIAKAYKDYRRSWFVRTFFPSFQLPAEQIEKAYKENRLEMELKELDNTIGRFASMVKSRPLWPQVKPVDSTLILDDYHKNIVAGFEKYENEDETSPLAIKSKRALEYWKLFEQGVLKPKDEIVWGTIQNQIKLDSTRDWSNLSRDEQNLLKAFLEIKVKQEQIAQTQQATMQLGGLIETINSNPSPEYRLKKAVDTLMKISGKVDSEGAARIKKYLKLASRWDLSREYKYIIEKIDQGWHLHIAVAGKGESPEWKKELITKIPGVERTETLNWQAGDVIYVALDSSHAEGVHPETYGENPRDLAKLDSRYSIFEMEGEITFSNGKTVIIRFEPELKGRLPEL